MKALSAIGIAQLRREPNVWRTSALIVGLVAALGHTTRSGARALALLHYWDTDTMNRQPSSHNNDSDFEVTVPSRLDELTANSRLEQQERNAAGWRRNLTYLGVVLVH